MNDKSKFSLLELMVTLTILLVAILGLLVAMNTLQLMNRTTKEVLVASIALNDKVETLRGMTVPNARQAIFDTIENPGTALAIQLNSLPGGGLNPVTGQSLFTYRFFAKESSVPIGAINIDALTPGVVTAANIQLEIDSDGTLPKMSFDMNVDGDKADDVTDDPVEAINYKFLPIQVRIRWRSVYGRRDPATQENFRELIVTTTLAEEKLE